MIETWKPVAGFERHYSVSSMGRIRRDEKCHASKPGRILKPIRLKNGYLRAVLHAAGEKQQVSIHRAVCIAFHGPGTEGQQVNHLNGIKDDNRAENLAWCTPSENQRHAVATGLSAFGEHHHNAKIDAYTVGLIRDGYASGKTIKELHERYHISRTQIGRIIRRQTWKHVA